VLFAFGSGASDFNTEDLIPDMILVIIAAIILYLVFFLPTLGVSVRRLHDTNHTGWWVLIDLLIPYLGWMAFLFFTLKDSTPGENEYGPNPKGNMATVVTPSNPLV